MQSGIGGSLFPRHFLADGVPRLPGIDFEATSIDGTRRRLQAWWRRVESTCGPATGLRAIFDLAAMPLAALLGFRARSAEFHATHATAWLTTRAGSAVALIVQPWSDRPPRRWRDMHAAAEWVGARWCLVVAPPFVSVVDASGPGSRGGIDFRLPDALEPDGGPVFVPLTRAETFDPRPDPTGRSMAALDRLAAAAVEYHDRVRDDLQRGVIEALGALGPAMAESPARPSVPARFDEALTIVYRVLFLLFAESRGLVPIGHPIYERAYAVTSLCREALGDARARVGLWAGLAAITRLARRGCDSRELIVSPFNGRLFARAAAPTLESPRRAYRPSPGSRRRDDAVARALVALGTRPGRAGREAITYADLGVEQLGAVYEHVLDLDPATAVGASGQPPSVHPRSHSVRRKTTGTFYTPRSLAEFLVRRTLAPLVRGASADAILSLRVVDPAMGSGAFLVAACRYLAEAYQRALVDEGRVPDADFDPDERADVRRLIAERCLAGVDANPVAVQLARVSLWLTTLARNKPLGFMDHRLRHGNSLIGASPDDLWRIGERGRASACPLFEGSGLEAAIRGIAAPLRELRLNRDATVADVHRKEAIWSALSSDRSPLTTWRLACHLWCARWFWSSTVGDNRPSAGEMRAALDAVLSGDDTLHRTIVDRWSAAARDLARGRAFFHWPIEFADVFYDDDGRPKQRSGFDAVVGNPPWEVLRGDPELMRFVRASGLYPSCDRGHLNLYQPFVDRALSIVRPGGRIGLALPWGLAVDDGAAHLRRRLFERGTVDTIVGFDNSRGLFPIHRGFRFMTIVASPAGAARDTRAIFGVRTTEEVEALPDSDAAGSRSAFPVRLTAATIRRVGGPTLRIPDLRRPTDLSWLDRLALEFPALGSDRGVGASFGRELNATDDRRWFGSRGLPVIEGKHIGPFAVDVGAAATRIPSPTARRLLADGRFERPRLAYRDVSAAGNRRALIAAIVPGGVVTTHTLFCLRTALPIEQQHYLCGILNSHVMNAVVRLLMGSHVTTSLVEYLPVPAWQATSIQGAIGRLARRLSRQPTSQGAALDLQAAVAVLYRLSREDLDAVLEANRVLAGNERTLIVDRVGRMRLL